MASFLNRLKSFDVYRDIPKDLTEPTTTGAIVSILSLLFISYLFLSEFVSFLTINHTSEMFIDSPLDTGDDHAMITINMNITTPHIPCALVSVDAQDVMGTHVVDVGGKLHKYRTDVDGQIKFNPMSGDMLSGETNGNAALQHQQLGEGCNMVGNMIVRMVPGNFHISAHAHADLLATFIPRGQMNCSHTVHSLYFGDTPPSALAHVSDAVIDPLHGTHRATVLAVGLDAETISKSYEYYIKVVPTQYQKLNGEILNSYQYVANSNDLLQQFRLPAIYFRYDMSPITVRFTASRPSFAHFLVQVCAIVGGTFCMLGLVNSMILASTKKFKTQIGKLG